AGGVQAVRVRWHVRGVHPDTGHRDRGRSHGDQPAWLHGPGPDRRRGAAAHELIHRTEHPDAARIPSAPHLFSILVSTMASPTRPILVLLATVILASSCGKGSSPVPPTPSSPSPSLSPSPRP